MLMQSMRGGEFPDRTVDGSGSLGFGFHARECFYLCVEVECKASQYEEVNVFPPLGVRFLSGYEVN